MTLTDLLNQTVTDPAARQKLADAIAKAGGKLDYTLGTVVPAGADLATYLAAAKPGDVLLPANPTAAYTCTAGVHPAADNVTLAFGGNPVTILPGVPGVTVAITPMGANFSFGGITIAAMPQNDSLMRCAGLAPNIHDVTVNCQVNDVLILDKAHGAKVSNLVATVPHGSRLIFNTGSDDTTILDPVSVGSLGEDCIRFGPANDGHVPSGHHVIRVKSLKTLKLPNKQPSTISLRRAGVTANDSFDISGGECDGWIRMGEEGHGGPTVANVLIHDITLGVDPAGINAIDAHAGTFALARVKFLIPDANRRAVGFATTSGSKMTSAVDCILQCPAGSTFTPKKLCNAGGVEIPGTNTQVVRA